MHVLAPFIGKVTLGRKIRLQANSSINNASYKIVVRGKRHFVLNKLLKLTGMSDSSAVAFFLIAFVRHKSRKAENMMATCLSAISENLLFSSSEQEYTRQN